MLDLVRHDPYPQRMLQLKDTPRFARDNLMMTRPQHKQVGQHSDTYGFLTAVLVSTDLELAQAQTRLQLPVEQFDRPALLGTYSPLVVASIRSDWSPEVSCCEGRRCAFLLRIKVTSPT